VKATIEADDIFLNFTNFLFVLAGAAAAIYDYVSGVESGGFIYFGLSLPIQVYSMMLYGFSDIAFNETLIWVDVGYIAFYLVGTIVMMTWVTTSWLACGSLLSLQQ